MATQQRIIIVGAGGFGREVYTWAGQMMAGDPTRTIAGFLDANSNALDGFQAAVPILGDPATYAPRPEDQFVCAIGAPAVKMKIAESLRNRGAWFVNVVHPTAIVGRNCELGEGAIVCPFVVVTDHVKLGDFVTLNLHAGVGHDAVLGDGTTLSPHCEVTGGARLGRGVFAGTHACVLPRVSVGDFAVLGAGSVVMRDVPPGTTVIGTPAKKVWTAAA